MGIWEGVSWIIFGLIVGLVARFVMPGRQNMSLLMTILLGIAGSFAGGTLSSILFQRGASIVQPSGWIMSVLGAVVVLFIYSRMKTASG